MVRFSRICQDGALVDDGSDCVENAIVGKQTNDVVLCEIGGNLRRQFAVVDEKV